MAEAPVLSKKQKKLSLSAKKTKSKETIRNVLATPYSKYWPVVSDIHAKELQNILGKCLPRIVSEKIKIPWNDLKKVHKSERKLFRNRFLEKQPDNGQIMLGDRDGLLFGINDITKAVEKGQVKSVLITEDVRPKLMVEHLIDQSVLLRFPALLVPHLRYFLKNNCGFTSIAIAFTNTNKYKTVQETIENIHKDYPIPRDHVNFQRSLDLLDTSVTVIDDSVMETSDQCINIPRDPVNFQRSLDLLDTSVTVIDDSVMEISDMSINMDDAANMIQICNKTTDTIDNTIVEEEIPASLYLYRDNKSKRVFIPDKSCDEVKNIPQMQVSSSGFLPFSDTETVTTIKKMSKSKIKKTSKSKEYKSLKVKKIRGDVNRNKRKIEEMKVKKDLKKKKKKIKSKKKGKLPH